MYPDTLLPSITDKTPHNCLTLTDHRSFEVIEAAPLPLATLAKSKSANIYTNSRYAFGI